MYTQRCIRENPILVITPNRARSSYNFVICTHQGWERRSQDLYHSQAWARISHLCRESLRYLGCAKIIFQLDWVQVDVVIKILAPIRPFLPTIPASYWRRIANAGYADSDCPARVRKDRKDLWNLRFRAHKRSAPFRVESAMYRAESAGCFSE